MPCADYRAHRAGRTRHRPKVDEAGSADYLGKQELAPSRLEHSIRYAIERQQLMIQLREANDALDVPVRKRTTELVAANESLLAETQERRRGGSLAES